MLKQLKLNEHIAVLRIFYILNAMNHCELGDRERRYRNAPTPRFQRSGFGRDWEIFEGIFEMKSQIQKVLFHIFQQNYNRFGLE